MRIREIKKIGWCQDSGSGDVAALISGDIVESNGERTSWELHWLFPPYANVEVFDQLCDMLNSDDYRLAPKVQCDEIGHFIVQNMVARHPDAIMSPEDSYKMQLGAWNNFCWRLGKHMGDKALTKSGSESKIIETVNPFSGSSPYPGPSFSGQTASEELRFYFEHMNDRCYRNDADRIFRRNVVKTAKALRDNEKITKTMIPYIPKPLASGNDTDVPGMIGLSTSMMIAS